MSFLDSGLSSLFLLIVVLTIIFFSFQHPFLSPDLVRTASPYAWHHPFARRSFSVRITVSSFPIAGTRVLAREFRLDLFMTMIQEDS